MRESEIERKNDLALRTVWLMDFDGVLELASVLITHTNTHSHVVVLQFIHSFAISKLNYYTFIRSKAHQIGSLPTLTPQ